MDARDMRVSDAEREHVGQLLQRAVGQGMLSLGEFTERMDTALAAKTRGELNAVLIDLPGLQLAHPDDRSYAPAPVAHASASNGDVDVIRGRMSTLTRKGDGGQLNTLQTVALRNHDMHCRREKIWSSRTAH